RGTAICQLRRPINETERLQSTGATVREESRECWNYCRTCLKKSSVFACASHRLTAESGIGRRNGEVNYRVSILDSIGDVMLEGPGVLGLAYWRHGRGGAARRTSGGASPMRSR